MTAEIAILNRTAVTLAADSAMSLATQETDGADKIYNTADKIFELSHFDPIGLMIYNNLEFMGVPLDVAIKEFRSSSHCMRVASVQDICTAFFNYLLTLIGDRDNQNRHARQLAAEALVMFRQVFDQEMRLAVRAMTNRLRAGGRQRQIDGHAIFLGASKKFTSAFEGLDPAESHKDLTVEDIIEYHDAAIDEAISRILVGFPLDNDDRNIIRRLVGLFLHRDIYSNLRTGLVFTGFAQSDLFPSLYTFEIDGAIAGRVKKRAERPIVIDRSDMSAEIAPFAQREMVDRFIDGIDPDFERAIPDYLESQMKKTGDLIISNVGTLSAPQKRSLERKLRRAIDVAIDEFKADAMEKTKNSYRKEIYDMVTFMPKQELANFAESLVNITSIKRKVSVGQETVGGPIDVAVISKGDGFVWVRRKHYFEAKFNPTFFHRKYGILSPPSGGN